jgi:hypothetical protein
MKKILYIPLLLIIVSCGGKGVEGNVGQIISIAAEEILEETNVDYNWIIMGQPDGSLLSPKDLKYKNNGQEMMFSPDYPGDYTFEVSITKFGDELSNQSFFFTISDIEDEDIEDIEDETSKEEEWLKESLEKYEEENDDEEDYEEESDDEEDYEEENDDNEEYEEENDDEEEVSKKQTIKKASTKAIVAKNRKTSNNKSVKGSDIPAKKDRFTIQVISKKRLADAQQYANKLIKSGYDAYIQKAYFKETEEVWYRVRIGSYDNYNSAQAIANVVSKDIKLSVWVDFVRIDN